MIQDISYKDYRRSEDIHGTVLYPAVMVAPVQKAVLEDLAAKSEIETILDPFHGSGTALFESHLVFPNAELIGCDINPFANLITKTKLRGVTTEICDDITTIETLLHRPLPEHIHEFPNREKWFRDDIAQSLTAIRNAIMEIGNEQNRLFFWCMMSDIIRRYSNTRSSTYKLHAKEKEKINSMDNHAIDNFIASINNNHPFYEAVHCGTFTLHKQDVFECLQEMAENSIDLIITSPPYGDNATTVPYGLFSSLALRWIDPNDLDLEGWELDNYSAIDTRSLGKAQKIGAFPKLQNDLLTPYVNQISENKRTKVQRFFHDYFACIDYLAKIAKHYIVLTLGNRTVDRVKIDLAQITGEYLEANGFIEVQTASRDILNKRTPPLTSSVNDQPVESMSKEYVLIYSKPLCN